GSPTVVAASAPRGGSRGWSARSDTAALRRLHLGTEEGRQAFEVQDPADQIRLLPDSVQPTPAEAAQPVPVFALAKEFFDLLPRPLGQPVPEPAGPHAHSRMRPLPPTRVHRDVGRDPPAQQRLDEAGGEKALVPAQRRGRDAEPTFGPPQQR